MASAAQLWPPVAGERGGDVRRDDRLPVLSEIGDRSRTTETDRRYPAPAVSVREAPVESGDLSVAEDVLWMAMEPGRGEMIRARYADHHTASLVFTRDDREGHFELGREPQTWWSHDMGKWMSWKEIGQYLGRREETFIVERLVRPGRSLNHQGCEPDGSCLQWGSCGGS